MCCELLQHVAVQLHLVIKHVARVDCCWRVAGSLYECIRQLFSECCCRVGLRSLLVCSHGLVPQFSASSKCSIRITKHRIRVKSRQMLCLLTRAPCLLQAARCGTKPGEREATKSQRSVYELGNSCSPPVLPLCSNCAPSVLGATRNFRYQL